LLQNKRLPWSFYVGPPFGFGPPPLAFAQASPPTRLNNIVNDNSLLQPATTPDDCFHYCSTAAASSRLAISLMAAEI